ncbi:Rab3 GTPase-activating protein catalytic subunit [Gryllus bimaculatus]|nr:Rab3 GTPase-activating protein catalytic subunit [Gryllus bimaculatus]
MSEDVENDFHHVDFTVASIWESFIKSLEEVIFEWKLPQSKRVSPLKRGDIEKAVWDKKTKKEKLSFADPGAGVTSPLEDETGDEDKVQALEDIMCFENDFLPQKMWLSSMGNVGQHPHPLAVWYGLRDFVIIAPNHDAVISSETRVKLLLSSLYIAVNNTNCSVPIFIQIHRASDQFYMGVCDGKEVRVDFEMVYLKRAPQHCRYLPGLLDVFKTKIASPLSLEQILLSVQFTYILRDWTSYKWTQQPPDFEFLQGETIGVTELGRLPFGATSDPVSELYLYATWPKLVDSAVTDGESYSDFEPSKAPHWSVQVRMADQPACLLSDYFEEFLQLCHCKRNMKDLIGDLMECDSSGIDISTSLSAITEPRVPTLSQVLKRNKTRPKAVVRDGAISHEHLMHMLYFLFPDAADGGVKPYPETWGNSEETKQLEMGSMKTVPVDSLVWRLSIVMSHVLSTLGAVRAAAQLWYEFCGEMLFRWDKGILIPGVPPGFPDHRTCLLNQKLQMLNCCIERRLNRETLARKTSVELEKLSSDSDDEDEFFDCSAEPSGGEGGGGGGEEAAAGAGPSRPGGGARRKQKHSLWNQPVGRLYKYGNLRLLKTGEHLYVPVTQDPSPKTEDQILEDVDVMVHLGTDAHAAELRARIMSASLLSDMESFKAANPGAILEDFIRWYSPRDWIEEEGIDEYGQKKGSLSPRMQIRGNVWVDVWEAAKPVPARRQKRLFDDTREAEKVLHFLKTQSPAQMAQLLLPTLLHACIVRLMEEERAELPDVMPTIQHIVKQAVRLAQQGNTAQDLPRYEDLSKEMTSVEEVIAQFKSLEHKFSPSGGEQSPELQAFLSHLMQNTQVDVPEGPRGPIGMKIRCMFAEAQKVAQMLSEYDLADSSEETWNSPFATNFPQPHKRHFIMRTHAKRPSTYSIACPQRLSAILQKDKYFPHYFIKVFNDLIFAGGLVLLFVKNVKIDATCLMQSCVLLIGNHIFNENFTDSVMTVNYSRKSRTLMIEI